MAICEIEDPLVDKSLGFMTPLVENIWDARMLWLRDMNHLVEENEKSGWDLGDLNKLQSNLSNLDVLQPQELRIRNIFIQAIHLLQPDGSSLHTDDSFFN